MNNSEGSLTNRKIKAIETKERIFQSAIKLFLQKGFNNVTIEDITSNAGLAKGTFYIYFQTKYDVIEKKYSEIDHCISKAAESLSKLSPTGKILKIAELTLLFLRDVARLEITRSLYSIEIGGSLENKFLLNEQRTMFNVFQKAINEGQKKGEFRNDLSSKELTIFVMRCIRALIVDWSLEGGEFDLVENGLHFISKFVLKALTS